MTADGLAGVQAIARLPAPARADGRCLPVEIVRSSAGTAFSQRRVKCLLRLPLFVWARPIVRSVDLADGQHIPDGLA